MDERTKIPQYLQMETRDDFIEGLRKIFEARKDLTPAGVSSEAGLDNSTVRKLLSGQNSSPRIETAEKISAAMGYRLSTVLEIGAGNIPISAIALVSRIESLPSEYSDEAMRYLDYLLGRADGQPPSEVAPARRGKAG